MRGVWDIRARWPALVLVVLSSNAEATVIGKEALKSARASYGMPDVWVVFEHGGLYGLRAANGRVLISPTLTAISSPNDVGTRVAVRTDGSTVLLYLRGFMGRNEREGGRDSWTYAPEIAWDEFSENRARFRAQDRWGYVDENNTVVIPATIPGKPGPFRGGLAHAQAWTKPEQQQINNTCEGYLDPDGRWAIPCDFKMARDFDGTYAVVLVADTWGYTFGNRVSNFFNGILAALVGAIGNPERKTIYDGKWGVIRRDGSFFVAPMHETEKDAERALRSMDSKEH